MLMAKMSGKKSTRHSLSLTIKDDNVNEWLNQQDNISLSLRMLINGAIRQAGFQDYPTYLSSLVTPSPTVTKPVNETKQAPVNEQVKPSEKAEPLENLSNAPTDNANAMSDDGIDFMGTLDKYK